MKLNTLLILLSCLVVSFHLNAQDLIYKKSGEKVEAIMIEKMGKSRPYKLFAHPDSVTYYISTSVLDSIVYQNGEKEDFRFNVPVNNLRQEFGGIHYRHNLVGIDLFSLVYSSFSVSYEYLPGKCKVGFKGKFAYNSHPQDFYPVYTTYSTVAKWHLTAGFNYYIFPQRSFRFVTGLHYLFGMYSSPENAGEKKRMQGMVLSTGAFCNFIPSFAMNLVLQNPVFMEPHFREKVLNIEILFNF
jgi:hypothetical protein